MGFVMRVVPGKAEVGSRTGRTRAVRQRSQGPSGREDRVRWSARRPLARCFRGWSPGGPVKRLEGAPQQRGCGLL